MSDLQSIIERVKFYETGFLILVSEENEMVLNDPYKITSKYAIYDTHITGLD